MQLTWKNRNSNKKPVYITKRKKKSQFSSKIPSATKHSPPSDVYYMEFHRNILIEYSLNGILKLKFTRRNET